MSGLDKKDYTPLKVELSDTGINFIKNYCQTLSNKIIEESKIRFEYSCDISSINSVIDAKRKEILEKRKFILEKVFPDIVDKDPVNFSLYVFDLIKNNKIEDFRKLLKIKNINEVSDEDYETLKNIFSELVSKLTFFGNKKHEKIKKQVILNAIRQKLIFDIINDYTKNPKNIKYVRSLFVDENGKINFYKSQVFQKSVTAYHIFGDKKRLFYNGGFYTRGDIKKQLDKIKNIEEYSKYKNTEFYNKSGNRLSISEGAIIYDGVDRPLYINGKKLLKDKIISMYKKYLVENPDLSYETRKKKAIEKIKSFIKHVLKCDDKKSENVLKFIFGDKKIKLTHKEIFLLLYKDYLEKLDGKIKIDGINLADFMVSLIKIESVYGIGVKHNKKEKKKTLYSPTGAKGIMQLTINPFEDFKQRPQAFYDTLKTNIEKVGISDISPVFVQKALYAIVTKDFDSEDKKYKKEFETYIDTIYNFLKNPKFKSVYFHKLNMLIGMTYFQSRFKETKTLSYPEILDSIKNSDKDLEHIVKMAKAFDEDVKDKITKNDVIKIINKIKTNTDLRILFYALRNYNGQKDYLKFYYKGKKVKELLQHRYYYALAILVNAYKNAGKI